MKESTPSNLRSLETRIINLARVRHTTVRHIQRAVANVVVGQMIPQGAVRGGAALKFRLGESASRFTTDFDAARPRSFAVGDYVAEFRIRLRHGWEGFTGSVELRPQAAPVGVPTEYVMQPLLVRLSYAGRHWLAVEFELGCDEIHGTLEAEPRLAPDLRRLFLTLGLAEPAPIPVLPVEHQIAQKLHACTAIGAVGENGRARDLVDLQLLLSAEPCPFEVIRAACERLFRARQGQAWPPVVQTYPSWPALYESASDGLEVLPNVHDAVDWVNGLIRDIDGALGSTTDRGGP